MFDLAIEVIPGSVFELVPIQNQVYRGIIETVDLFSIFSLNLNRSNYGGNLQFLKETAVYTGKENARVLLNIPLEVEDSIAQGPVSRIENGAVSDELLLKVSIPEHAVSSFSRSNNTEVESNPGSGQ